MAKKKIEIPRVTTKGIALIEELHKELGQISPGLVNYLPTGCYLLDLFTGGGLPIGMVVELYGKETGGKTSLGLTFIRSAQALGGVGVYLETERKTNREFAKSLGVDISSSKLIWLQPETMEEALDDIEKTVAKLRGYEAPVLIFWDSLAATGGIDSCEEMRDTEQKKVRGINIMDLNKDQIAIEARLLSKFFKRRTIKQMRDTNCVLVISNQLRDAIGRSFGEMTTVPGGRSVKHAIALRLKVEDMQTLPGSGARIDGKKSGVVPGIWIKITTTKNNNAPPYRSGYIPFSFSSGVDDVLTNLIFLQMNHKLGYNKGWFEMNGKRFTKASLRELCYTDANIRQEIEELVKQTYVESLDLIITEE